MKYHIYCDGGCLVGKGIGAATYIITSVNGFSCHTTQLIHPTLTNNMAEYAAVWISLHDILLDKDVAVVVHSDSELVIKQLSGSYKAKKSELVTQRDNILNFIKENNYDVEFVHVPRENNYIQYCDKINKLTMGVVLNED